MTEISEIKEELSLWQRRRHQFQTTLRNLLEDEIEELDLYGSDVLPGGILFCGDIGKKEFLKNKIRECDDVIAVLEAKVAADDTKSGAKDHRGESKSTAKSKTGEIWDKIALKAKDIQRKTPGITREDLAAELAVKENFDGREVPAISTIEREVSKRGIHTLKGRRPNT